MNGMFKSFSLIAATLLSASVSADVYRCIGEDGRTIFSGVPCSNNAVRVEDWKLKANSGSLGSRSSQSNHGTPEYQATGTANATYDVNREGIKSRYRDLRGYVRRLAGVDNPKLQEEMVALVDRNMNRALRARRESAQRLDIHNHYDGLSKDLHSRLNGKPKQLARELVILEAKRDTELFGLTPLVNGGFAGPTPSSRATRKPNRMPVTTAPPVPAPVPSVITNCDPGGCWDDVGNRYNKGAGTTHFTQDGRVCQNIGGMMQCN